MASRNILEFFSKAAPPPSRNEISSGLEEKSGTSTICSHDESGIDVGPSLIPLSKRARSHTRQSDFDRAWLKSFPWVLDVEGEGMLCRLCRKHAWRPQKAVVEKTWVDVPCVIMI